MPYTETRKSEKLTSVGIDNLVDFDEQSAAPGTPSSGKVRVYAKNDGKLYFKDDAGNETSLDTALNVLKSLFNSHTILAATVDNNPAALTMATNTVALRAGGNIEALAMAASTGLFRLGSGDIVAATTTQIHALLGGILPRRSGTYCDGSLTGLTTGADHTLVADDLIAIPFLVLGEAWTSIGLEVTVLEAAKNMRLGIYALAADGTPGALELDAGEVSVATTGFKEITSIAQTLAPGFWYLAVNSDATGTAEVKTANRNTFRALGAGGGGQAGATTWVKAGTAYGALPDPFPSSPTAFTTAGMVRILMSVT